MSSSLPLMLQSPLPGVVPPLRPSLSGPGLSFGQDISDNYSLNANPAAYYPPQPHSRQSSNASATSYHSLASTQITSPENSPPSAGLKHSQQQQQLTGQQQPQSLIGPAARSHSLRRSRANTGPYPRDPLGIHSDVYSSSSETEDFMYQNHPQSYPNTMYIHPSVAHMDAHPMAHQPQPSYHPRMQMAQDSNNLEQLAANVRTATTTSASDRAKQIFVHAWLNANYTPYADGNVPRQGLYCSYRRVCDQYGIPHMNTATLGKAIRLCFTNIKTRRLGVRGNSKYHYCGIRPSNAAESEWLQDYIRKTNTAGGHAVARANSHSSRASGGVGGGGDSDEDDEADSPEGPQSGSVSKRSSLNLDNFKGPIAGGLDEKTPTTSSVLAAAQGVAPSTASQAGLQQAAAIRRRSAQPGDPVFSGVQPGGSPFTTPPPTSAGAPGIAATSTGFSIRHLPTFPKIEEALGAASASPQGVAAREVWRWFEDHLDALLESARAFRFDQFELHLRTFWSGLIGDHREVVHAPAVAGLMAKADALLYDEILETLRSQILAPIPPSALSSLRGLADQMEKVLLLALEGYGSTFVEPKVELGARFGHLVLRFLDIYQVTQALATVLQNPKQLGDMRRAWSEIDFESVRNQSALVCNCRHEDLMQLLEMDFVQLLDGLTRSNEPVRDVMVWADDCCERLMGANRGDDRGTLSSRSVLIRWGYVTSQIMRDLTIRSDAAFGAFQILKLFLDDWIALNVLRAVALSTNSVAASVEPVIQQQFFTLSPPNGTEGDAFASTSGAASGLEHGHSGTNVMDHTPTAMLAGLGDTTFSQPSLDTTSFGVGAFDGMGFMDSTSHSNGTNGNVGGMNDGLMSHGGMSFGDFGVSAGTPGGFDVSSFTQEFVMGGSASNEESGAIDSIGGPETSSLKDENAVGV